VRHFYVSQLKLCGSLSEKKHVELESIIFAAYIGKYRKELGKRFKDKSELHSYCLRRAKTTVKHNIEIVDSDYSREKSGHN